MGNIETPVTIGSLPRTRTELIPAASPLTTFQSGTRADVPENPKENSYTQLGAALAHFSGTAGVATVSHVADIQREHQTLEGEEVARKAASDQSVKNVNELVAKGYLAEGASPTSILAAKTNFLKLRGEQAQSRFREDYYANDELRNSDDPDAFRTWAAKWKQDNDKSQLLDHRGAPMYSALELSKSNFDDRVNAGINGVHNEHVAHRVAARQEEAHTVARNLFSVRLDHGLGTGKSLNPDTWDLPMVGKALHDVYYGPTGQVILGGQNPTKASKDMVDGLVEKAIREKNPDVFKLGDHIEAGPGSKLSGTAYFKAERDKAEHEIAGTKYIDMKRDYEWAEMKEKGTPEEVAKITGDKYRLANTEATRNNRTDALNRVVYSFDPLSKDPKTQKSIHDALAELQKHDGAEFQKTTHALDMIRATNPEVTHAQNLAEAKLQNVVDASPGTKATNDTLYWSLYHKDITPEGYRRLRSRSDENGNDERDPRVRQILASAELTNYQSAVGGGVLGDPTKALGTAKTAAGLAMGQFRTEARQLIKDNPTWNAVQVAAAMRKRVTEIPSEYSKVFKEELDAQKVQKEADDATIKRIEDKRKAEDDRIAQEQKHAAEMQPRVEAEVKALKAAPPYKEPVDIKNFKAAQTDLKMTPQEENIYRHHLTNLNGTGKVENADGTISTVYQISFEADGKTYNVPTVWNGKILSPDDSIKKAKAIGLDKFPAYKSEADAELRYQKMHDYMERDTMAYQKKNPKKKK